MPDYEFGYMAASIPGAGHYKCTKCGYEFDLKDGEPLPRCPKCGNDRFQRISKKNRPYRVSP